MIGKFKDEARGHFVGLRAKRYSFKVDGLNEEKKWKGIEKNVIKKETTFEDYNIAGRSHGFEIAGTVGRRYPCIPDRAPWWYNFSWVCHPESQIKKWSTWSYRCMREVANHERSVRVARGDSWVQL